jgi:hypothetical protein
MRGIINPDKLRHLGPLADVRAMLHDIKAQRHAGRATPTSG